ncbi:MAG: hypothetical protein QW815_03080 [Nitrososphaerota archaeon]
MYKVYAVPVTDPIVQEYVVKFTMKTKFAELGHISWVYSKLVAMNALTYIVTDDIGRVKMVSCFVLDGKDEAQNVLTYSDSKSVEETKTMTDLVKKELKKLGVREIFTIIWGDYKRGEAAEKLFGGKVKGTYLVINLD